MNRKGFTLIELMVVVLIIGILSSIALPQYQKAIKKARVVEAMTVGKKILEAEKVYFLENQEYTTDLSKLRIHIPTLKNFTIGNLGINGNAGRALQVSLVGQNNLTGIDPIFVVVPPPDGRMFVDCLANECDKFLPCSPTDRQNIMLLPGGRFSNVCLL